MDPVTIIVATFGSDDWHRAGHFTASLLAKQHMPAHTVRHYHGRTLADARNSAAYEADPGWLCFVDADDDLDPGYIHALAGPSGSGDLRAPAVRWDDGPAVSLADRNIDTMNPCVIGTLIRRQMFLDAGGFWHERAWEDWSLFRRAWLLGAEIGHHPEAVYHVNTRPDSRNNTVARPEQLHRDIRAAHTAWLATR